MAIRIRKSKRAIFFSFIAIMILAFFMVVFSNVYSAEVFKAELDVFEAQIKRANSFVSFVEDAYIPQILEVNARVATWSLIDWIDTNSDFPATNFDELETLYNNLIINGTIDGVNFVPAMAEHNMKFWLGNISNLVDSDLHFNVTYNMSDAYVRIYQTNPWYLTANLTFPMNIRAINSEWNLTENVYQINLSIAGFEDPLYVVNIDPAFRNNISQTNSSLGRAGFWYNASQVSNSLFVANSYVKDAFSPSFLQHFYNDTTSSECCGIQSIVLPGINAPNDIDIADEFSFIDYSFFHGDAYNCNQLYFIPDLSLNTNRRLKFDRRSMIRFNLTGSFCFNDLDNCDCLDIWY